MSQQRIDLAALRKEKSLSQADLAKAAGISQTTVSRIEKSEHQPDLRLWAKIARVLGVDIREIAPDELLVEVLGEERDYFFAFCPNPFCDRNETSLKDGSAQVYWRSAQRYPGSRYSAVNFCSRCGTELVKDCPGCSLSLEDAGSRYCISCGTQITNRPTKEEWERIRALLTEEDDIPF
jgi:putative transcriptional regulator